MCGKRAALDALMGIPCSTNTGSESDETNKDSGNTPHRSHAMPSRQSSMTVANHRTKRQRRGERAEFKFLFQDDMASRADGRAIPHEADVNIKLARMRVADDIIFSGASRSPGGHFLEVRDLVEKTRLFNVARMVPKGAHLHLHFNSTLPPGVLLGYAKEMANMYVWSDHRLLEEGDFERCNLEFSLRNLGQVRKEMHAVAIKPNDSEMKQKLEHAESLSDEAAKTRAYDELGPNIFSSDYKHGKKDKNQQVEEMRYQYFRERWDEKARGSCDEWLISKLTFSKMEMESFFGEGGDLDPEAESDTEKTPTRAKPTVPNAGQSPLYGAKPTISNEDKWAAETKKKIANSTHKDTRRSARRAWIAFNGRTKMMKGLFNYETAFRRYTRKCLEEFVKDNVQYAEIRPNFMQTNQILDDKAEVKIDNFGTMKLIIEEYEKFMKHIGDMGADGKIIVDQGHRPTFSGMKVIYCTPRSFSRDAVRMALDECIKMKRRWPDYIAGFDLVGEEAFAKPHPLKYFEEDFREFRARCKKEDLDIPFLFHCGETPDDLEGNLETALRLESKRIGHGYALPEKAEVLKEMRSKNVCVETCPISNMVLGLARRMDEHSVYRLLEEKMHCAVSSDNGTLFQSTLSHDFYEVIAGNQKINLYGWKQLARWSLEHSCLSVEERKRALTEWEKRWQDFIHALTELPNIEDCFLTQALEMARQRAETRRLAKL